jgi:hypothetical protein
LGSRKQLRIFSLEESFVDIGIFKKVGNTMIETINSANREQHISLFAQIFQVISQQSARLADIRYAIADTGITSPLLHQTEIAHLQNFENLIAAPK